MTDPAISPPPPSRKAPSLGLFSLARWVLGLGLTAALSFFVLRAWVFVTIRGMPQKQTLILLAAGAVAVMVITAGLFRSTRRHWQGLGILILAAVWIGSCTAVAFRVLDENVGEPAKLGPFFGLCTLVVPALLWFWAWSGSFVARVSVTGLLIAGIPLFHQFARIDGLSGDETKVSMAWRRTAPELVKATPRPKEESNSTDFVQYLGPSRDGRMNDVSLATDWDAHAPKLLWRQPIGSGLGAFSVVGNRAVTQQQIGPEEAITCLDLNNGKTLWEFKYPALFEHGLAKSGPRSTPAIHDGKVFAIGALGTLSCLNLETGAKIWQVDTAVKEAKEIPYGVAGSPLLVGDRVIVCRPSVDGKSVAAYDVSTGKLIWEGGNAEAAYSSPILASLAGEEEIVVFNAENIIGLDPVTGALRWSFPWTNNEKNNCSQPIVIPGKPDRLFVSTGYGKGAVLLALEKAEDGTITPRPLWESKQMKNKFSTSFVIDDTVYGLDDGILSAIELETGKKRWKKDRIGHGQLLLVGGKLLVLTESGDLQLFEVSPKGSNRLGVVSGALEGKTWNHMALATPFLLVRNDHEAACYVLDVEPTDKSSEPAKP